jgi:ATP-dependent DNA helicase RecG
MGVRGKGRVLHELRVEDGSGILNLKWFYFPKGLETKLLPGTRLTLIGTPKIYRNVFEMIHPEIRWDREENSNPHVERIVPIYSEIEAVSTSVLRRILWEALEKYGARWEEDLPKSLVEKYHFPSAATSIREMHYPSSQEGQEKCRTRLVYEEFLKFELLVLRKRLQIARVAAPVWDLSALRSHVKSLEDRLPFPLTRGQTLALAEILQDLCSSKKGPMNRLLQGDVGSGKTVVALLSAGAIIGEGSQAVLMAPTEILAEQHFRSAKTLLGDTLPIELLMGSTRTEERIRILGRLERGEPLLLLGTHAVLEDPVKFRKLDLVMIDEQHRFGVEQRRKLRNKGIRECHPHQMVLTATPIPRTLSLTYYGDLESSVLRDRPPGRKPIFTKVLRTPEDRIESLRRIHLEIKNGRQAYFIYPLVEESEAEGFTELRSALQEHARLQNEVFPDLRVGLLHGQMKSQEKERVMQGFKEGAIQILVSTTVVEVGVDVPNATLMYIEHAERFGLSQLHQLRGRVGRGTHASTCFLATRPHVTDAAYARLSILERSQDGFEIAEEDLKIRGPGEFLGTRQAGSLAFLVADLVRDQSWLLQAREDALEILKKDPELQDLAHQCLHRFIEQEGQLQSARLHTS